MIHYPVTQVQLGTARHWQLLIPIPYLNISASLPKLLPFAFVHTERHCTKSNKIKTNKQTKPPYCISNPNIPFWFLDLFSKTLAASSSFMSPENPTSFYFSNNITTENTEMQDRIPRLWQSFNQATNAHQFSICSAIRSTRGLYRSFLMLKSENVS